MRIEEFQFGAMMVTALLTLTLMTQIPPHVGRTVNRARWMMVGAMTLLFVQFLLQYIFGFRARSATLGVAVNLLFFIPCSCMMTVAILYLQRHGTVPKSAWVMGGLCWGGTAILLAVTGGQITTYPHFQLQLNESPALQTAEYIAALGFGATQLWFCNLNFKEYKKLKRTLDNYNDDDTEELLQWMHNTVMMLSTAAMLIPLIIFLPNTILVLFSILFFCTIYYCIIRFYRYSVSNTPELVEQAQDEEEEEVYDAKGTEEESQDETQQTGRAGINTVIFEHVSEAVNQWIEQKGYLRKKATLQHVADDMNVPRNQLSTWLKATDKIFNQWINSLRIEEAKRLMTEHPDWSNDSIADACGFGSRSYFQTVFKENTGMTPAQFIAE